MFIFHKHINWTFYGYHSMAYLLSLEFFVGFWWNFTWKTFTKLISAMWIWVHQSEFLFHFKTWMWFSVYLNFHPTEKMYWESVGRNDIRILYHIQSYDKQWLIIWLKFSFIVKTACGCSWVCKFTLTVRFDYDSFVSWLVISCYMLPTSLPQEGRKHGTLIEYAGFLSLSVL